MKHFIQHFILMAVLFLGAAISLTAQTNNDPLYIDSSGRVGIGTTTPKARLAVGPTLQGTYSSTFVTNAGGLGLKPGDKIYLANIGFTSGNNTSLGIKALRTADGGDWSTAAIGLTFDVDATSPVNGSQLWMLSNGNIGIGKTNPNTKLDVSGSIHSDREIYAATFLKADGDSYLFSRGFNDGTSNVVLRNDKSFAYIYPWGTGNSENTVVVGGAVNTNLRITGKTIMGTNDVVVLTNGYVGIGTPTPEVPLDIKNEGTHINVGRQWLYWIRGGSKPGDNGTVANHNNEGNNYSGTVSIRAAGIVVGNNFFTMSDARMKTGFSLSNTAKDLQLLNRLTVTDYYYKDIATQGNLPNKGFVAQEIEKLFPQAVEKHADFVPDIFLLADKIDVSGNELIISMGQPHHLTDGDIVRLITEKEGMKEVPVKVNNEKVFTVTGWDAAATKIFVYGKKVDDCETVNYQQIFSLGISAIQELSKQVDELKKENKNLRSGMELKIELLEKKIGLLIAGAEAGKKN